MICLSSPPSTPPPQLPDQNPYQPTLLGGRDPLADLGGGTWKSGFARYGVLLFLCTLALLLYIDRVCIGQAATQIKKDLGLTDAHMGWAFNAFMIAYCVLEVPTGHWGDRF